MDFGVHFVVSSSKKEWRLGQICPCGNKGIFALPYYVEHCISCGRRLLALKGEYPHSSIKLSRCEDQVVYPGGTSYTWTTPVTEYELRPDGLTLAKTGTALNKITLDFEKGQVQTYEGVKKVAPTRSSPLGDLYLEEGANPADPRLLQKGENDLSLQLIAQWNRYMTYWPINRVPTYSDWVIGLPLTNTLLALTRLFKYPQLTLLTQKEHWEPFCRKIWEWGAWKNDYNLEGTNPLGILQITKGQDALLEKYWAKSKARHWDKSTNIKRKGRHMKELNNLLPKDLVTRLHTRWALLNWSLVSAIEELLQVGIEATYLGNWMMNHTSYRQLKSDLISLRDAIRMGAGPPYNIRRLLREHDELARKYQVEKSEIARRQLRQVQEENSKLEYTEGLFSFELPKTLEDFETESAKLRHCVKSYAQGHIGRATLIIFLRKEGKPHLTIEVKKGRVVQVRGFGNRSPEKEEIDLIKRWAKLNRIGY